MDKSQEKKRKKARFMRNAQKNSRMDVKMKKSQENISTMKKVIHIVKWGICVENPLIHRVIHFIHNG